MRKTILKAMSGLMVVSISLLGLAGTSEAASQTTKVNQFSWNSCNWFKSGQNFNSVYKFPVYQFVWNGNEYRLVPQQPSTQPVKPPVSVPKPAPVEKPEQKQPAQNTPAAEDNAGVAQEVQQVLALVNQERQKAGLQPLKLNQSLTAVATKKAADMRDNNYFSHNSPTYGSPFDMMKAFGITYTAAGENIAAGQRTPEEVMKGWMNSPGHRANILNKNYTEIGIGYVEGGSYGTYWVQMFIRP